MTSLSFSLGGATPTQKQKQAGPSPPSRNNGTKKRDHSALLDDPSDDEAPQSGKRQQITHFDVAAGGAVDATKKKEEEKKPLVIAALKNRDWREESRQARARKYGISVGAKEDEKSGEAEGADKVVKETHGVRYGLNVKERSTSAVEEDHTIGEEAAVVEQKPDEVEKTDEQRAIDALTGVQPVSTLTIPANEEEAFATSYATAPPAPSLSDYDAVPVEEYGAAMLRGMGWKGPSTTSTPASKKKQPPPAKRPALLGIGADPNAAVAEELGAWGRKTGRGRDKDIVYNPLVLKNKGTGERVTEDELKEKMRLQKEKAANERFVVGDLEIRDKRGDDGRERRRDGHDGDEDRRRRRREDSRERRHGRKDRDRDYDRRDREREHGRYRDDSRRRRDRSRDSHRRDRDDYDKSGSGGRRRDDDERSSHRRDKERSSRHADDDRDRKYRSSRR